MIGKGGAKIAQLQRETKCRITLNREDRSRVVLRGTRTALAAAREHIAALVATYARENQSVDCPDDLANVLIARAGHMAKMVEKEHGVRCRVDRTGNKLRISGPEANVVAAKAAIAEILKRKPDAFEPKVDGSNAHTQGCNCKNSKCQKAYCECFERGVLCTDKCKCIDCRNCEAHGAKPRERPEPAA